MNIEDTKFYQSIITSAEDDVIDLLNSSHIEYQLIRLTPNDVK